MVQKRADELASGEKTRILHWLKQLKASVMGAEVALRCDGAIGYDVPQSLMTAVQNLSMSMATHDAYAQLAEIELRDLEESLAKDRANSHDPAIGEGLAKEKKL